jgi:hypothetical protein
MPDGSKSVELGFGFLAPTLTSQNLVEVSNFGAIRFESVRFAISAAAAGEGIRPSALTAEATLKGLSLNLAPRLSSLLESLLGDGIGYAHGDLSVIWEKDQIRFGGSGGPELALPLRRSVGPLRLDTFYLRLGLGGAGLEIEATFDVALVLGPGNGISVSLNRVGMRGGLDASDLGLPRLTLGSRPPGGAGLALDLGPVTGGGTLLVDEPAGRYAGLLAANLWGIGVTAAAVIATKLPPDNHPGFSLLVTLMADFRPAGIELSLGFTLNAIGGLIGFNRCCDLEQLRLGVRTGAIQSLMFPPDPLRNAARILTDLDRFFPPAEGQMVLGPMLELGWGKPAGMIALRIGLILQLPDLKIAVPGLLKIEIPPGLGSVALIRLQADFLGWADPAAGLAGLDGSLFDSHFLLGTLEGDICVRLRTKGSPDLLISAGGFHPRYQPPADLALGTLARLAISLSAGIARLRFETYFAVTPNTIQHGARVEVQIGFDDFGVAGFLAYDVIIVLSPFSFVARFAAGLEVQIGGETIASISIDGELSGPDPMRLRGEGSFKLLFVRVSVPIDITIGSTPQPPELQIELFRLLCDELRKPGNTVPELPPGRDPRHIIRRDANKPGTTVALEPNGNILVSQGLVPLGIEIARYGDARPSDGRRFSIGRPTVVIGGELASLSLGKAPKRQFAPATYLDLSEDQKLSQKAFEDYPAGARIEGDGLPAFSAVTKADFAPEAILVDRERPRRVFKLVRPLPPVVIAALIKGGPAALSPARRRPVEPSPIRRVPDRFIVVTTDELSPGLAAFEFDTQTHALAEIERRVAEDRSLTGRLRAVSTYELAV